MKQFLTGARGIEEAIKKGRGILYTSTNSGRCATLGKLAAQYGIPVEMVEKHRLNSLLNHREHRGYALVIENDKNEKKDNLDSVISTSSEQAFLVALDGVTDPGNLGAVLRCADQFSVDAVLVPGRRSVSLNAESLSRTSSGAVEWVTLLETGNLVSTIKKLKQNGFWIWGADEQGKTPEEQSLTGRVVLVMGSEGRGLHKLVRESCDGLVRIPTSGRINSLNVATAAGILMYEKRRQDEFSNSDDD